MLLNLSVKPLTFSYKKKTQITDGIKMVSVFVLVGNQICKRRGRDEENIDKHELVLFIQGPESMI